MTLDFTKSDGLIPVIIQDHKTLKVLMLGYMNAEALEKTRADGKVTFFSRSKNRLWTKGETSGNFLIVKSIWDDCDHDALLIRAEAQGPTCHTGEQSCFNGETQEGFLYELEQIVAKRSLVSPDESYTAKLLARGINKVAQKVGEEAVELVIEAKDDNKELFVGEAADLLYHFLVLLRAKNITISDIEAELKKRHQK